MMSVKLTWYEDLEWHMSIADEFSALLEPSSPFSLHSLPDHASMGEFLLSFLFLFLLVSCWLVTLPY